MQDANVKACGLRLQAVAVLSNETQPPKSCLRRRGLPSHIHKAVVLVPSRPHAWNLTSAVSYELAARGVQNLNACRKFVDLTDESDAAAGRRPKDDTQKIRRMSTLCHF